jgi:hypothetical protein
MPKVSMCPISLFVLHRAQSLINSIVNDMHLTSIVALLASKIDSLEHQIDTSHQTAAPSCTHTHTSTPQPVKNVTPQRDYATVASTPPWQPSAAPDTKDQPTSPDRTKDIPLPTATDNPAFILPITPSATAKRSTPDQVIVRFEYPPAPSKCLHLWAICNTINEA